jgi:rhodanese-related sulfurtransferase
MSALLSGLEFAVICRHGVRSVAVLAASLLKKEINGGAAL